jgi:hypothetical protein
MNVFLLCLVLAVGRSSRLKMTFVKMAKARITKNPLRNPSNLHIQGAHWRMKPTLSFHLIRYGAKRLLTPSVLLWHHFRRMDRMSGGKSEISYFC